MATEVRKFEVGVFVISATVIAIGAAVWLGASRFFEDTRHVVTYVSESVQGLDPGSAVKYRGVPAGRVARIGIAADGRLIEILMDIDAKFANALQGDDKLRAQLELSGITGLRYIEIDRRSGDALNQAPALSFQPPYDVIPSARSSFKAVQEALADMYEKVMQVDLVTILADARTALQAFSRLAQDQRISTVLTNFAAASVSAQKAAKNAEAMTTGLQIAPAVANATQAAEEAKTLFAKLNQAVKGDQLAQTFDQLNRLAVSMQQVLLGLQSATVRLDRALGNLQGLTDDVRQQPSRLLFGEPAAGRRASDGSVP